ncbi:DUF4386 domain-containing protein [Micromonospora sp. WMMD1082]|uniref:DUF4386 domain-containing protein n=1 Tax=Micromonospora sp. WMMD1082 TaxID=3016104 RepID=UPI002416E260|nr:DUF4386 domain-containing protein [Micromonospora sp. WMMD1082]MDG4797903.1 DUF4386 domain-containing protein [Micromonospora sp. WMMD1082]
MPTPRRLARIAGLLYLIMGVCGAFAEIVRVTVYRPGDAATTAANVAAHAGLVRASVVADLVAVPTGLFTAMALYLLLKHVHANAARAMVALLGIAAAMMTLNLAHQYQALLVSDAAYTGAFAGPGSDALVLLMLDLHHSGYLMTQVFFGLWLLPMGYLVYRSGMIPRVIGVLLVVGCLGYLVDTFARFAAPELGAALSPYAVTPPAVAEVSMMLWLLVRGVNVPQPDRPAARAAAVNP